MPFQQIIKVANASPYERSDYVEAELGSLGVPIGLDETNLRLSRVWNEGNRKEVRYQIDYPFGRQAGYRILTFFSEATPPGPDDYSQHTAEFLLEEGTPHDFSDSVRKGLLKVEHYSRPGEFDTTWDPNKAVIGVRLCNGGDTPEMGHNGLQVYFSLVPRPEFASPANYAGAATSILHHRAWRATRAGEVLHAPWEWSSPAPQKRWGQLTRIDLYGTPWDKSWYQAESLLGQPGNEPAYTLAWSNSGHLRATVSLRSQAIVVRYSGRPFFQPDEKVLTCHLYRFISLYPEKEFYTEQLFLRPEGEEVASLKERLSLAFRAHFYSYVDYAPDIAPAPSRLAEDVPDYFAIWRSFAAEHRGYAFASDPHFRGFKLLGPEFSWRLELGHEHRCVHLFPFHSYPDVNINRLGQIGHTWYEWLLRPLRPIPLDCQYSAREGLREDNMPELLLRRGVLPRNVSSLGPDTERVESPREPSGFRPGPALTNRDKLWGRQTEIDSVLGFCAQRALVGLLGPRRAGKTSLLRALGSRLLADGYKVRHISLEGTDVRTESDLARRLDNNLPRRAAADVLRRRLRDEERSVLLIDEVAYLQNATPRLFAWLRAIGQEQEAVIIYAGTHWDWARVILAANRGKPGSSTYKPGSPFGNDVNEIALGPIPRDDAIKFLVESTPIDVRGKLTPLWILELCGTWPFYLQVMGHAVVQAVRAGNRRALDSSDGVAELYKSRLLEGWDTVFRGRWYELPTNAQMVLLSDMDYVPPEFSRLKLGDKAILCDVGLSSSTIYGWIEDRPFYDWIRHNVDALRGDLRGQDLQ